MKVKLCVISFSFHCHSQSSHSNVLQRQSWAQAGEYCSILSVSLRQELKCFPSPHQHHRHGWPFIFNITCWLKVIRVFGFSPLVWFCDWKKSGILFTYSFIFYRLIPFREGGANLGVHPGQYTRQPFTLTFTSVVSLGEQS